MQLNFELFFVFKFRFFYCSFSTMTSLEVLSIGLGEVYLNQLRWRRINMPMVDVVPVSLELLLALGLEYCSKEGGGGWGEVELSEDETSVVEAVVVVTAGLWEEEEIA